FFLTAFALQGQAIVYYQPINADPIDLTGNTKILATIVADIPSPGKVIVHFDGGVYPYPGDRIILAASNDTDWHADDGHIEIEIPDGNFGKSFSHTRVYQVTAGMHSFYAVAQNTIETDGIGMAFIDGALVATFYPDAGPQAVTSLGFVFNGAVANTVTLAQQTIHASSSGKIIVRFDGYTTSSAGDKIVFASSNTSNWLPNDGSVSVEAVDDDVNENSFSHTREYDVSAAGDYTFNALAQNFGETDGNGVVSVYGNLVAEFYPNSGSTRIAFRGFSQPAIDLAGPAVGLDSVTINAPEPGSVIVDFDGEVSSDPSNYVVLAASNGIYIVVGSNVTLHPFDADVNRNSFAHSRVFPVSAGIHTFYGVGRILETGPAIVDVSGELTARFFPDEIASSVHDAGSSDNVFSVFPNPAEDMLSVSFYDGLHSDHKAKLLDVSGCVQKIYQCNGSDEIKMDLSSLPPGIYFVESGGVVKEVLKM
ncbi:MAG: T9SS type A sorting domain-containing protein, partial [Saprospiraceae bacterium]